MASEIKDLIGKFEGGKYAFSEFLGLSETDESLRELRGQTVPFEFYGGYEDAERTILRIGNEDSLGYDAKYPISYIKVSPKNKKFSDALTHRDFLGSLMNLGINRNTIGDIILKDNVGYVICLEHMAAYIMENLTRVKHTTVVCEKIPELPDITEKEPEELFLLVPSFRADAIISKAWNLSRSTTSELFSLGKVFLDGRQLLSPGQTLRENSVLSVRGFGRLTVGEETGLSKKGKIKLKVYVK
ncbi:MAG: YlmH/Sll1252 family protein [Oscillospiraceae bacterium]|nr:YlmH/Sll1252 family protein [Oscillospiraceae bacterium]